ncbi:MAG TPA: protein kinase, partial [Acidimicrobiales bacterium]
MSTTRMSAEIGRVLGGRYRLVAPVGMGASAQVFLADDARLRRRVAVKMLHAALADDADFLRRFRAEARSAAALNHPHVLAVYDWGEDDTPFIVTEFLGGGSMRSLLDRGAVLAPAQALLVGVEAARALDYAHRRGFVHRDIKPANLLFGDEGRLRIADFGLARALAEAAWTEPQGAVLGTARYASPEQAKGMTLTGKADVYSLALVLVEAVTGEVPFTADTTLGTLMARVDRPLVVPEALGPLRSVLERAGHPDPDQRIDARMLAGGLLAAAKRLARPEPLTLAGALPADGVLVLDDAPTLHGPGSIAPVPPVAEATVDLTAEPKIDLTPDDLDLDPPHWVNQAEPAVNALDGWLADEGAEGEDDGEPALIDLTDEADDPGPADTTHLADADADREADASTADATSAVDMAALLDDEAAPRQVDATAAGAAPILFDGEREESHRILEPVAAAPGPAADAPVLLEAPRRRRRRWPWVAVAAILVLGGGGTAGAVAFAHRPTANPTIRFPVPALAGQDPAAALRLAHAFGWKLNVQHGRKDHSTVGQL